MNPTPKTTGLTRLEREAAKIMEAVWWKEAGDERAVQSVVRFAQSYGRRLLREAAEVAHIEAIENKAAAFRALAAGRSLVSEFRDSDGECAARIEANILKLSHQSRAKVKGRKSK